mmetsp:Transcript_7531/g.21351  ORF Transcript_7531/g.21351 Transcript_7531/m.21351 type:complete len:227 (-) Transcript_7531:53-733(-)
MIQPLKKRSDALGLGDRTGLVSRPLPSLDPGPGIQPWQAPPWQQTLEHTTAAATKGAAPASSSPWCSSSSNPWVREPLPPWRARRLRLRPQGTPPPPTRQAARPPLGRRCCGPPRGLRKERLPPHRLPGRGRLRGHSSHLRRSCGGRHTSARLTLPPGNSTALPAIRPCRATSPSCSTCRPSTAASTPSRHATLTTMLNLAPAVELRASPARIGRGRGPRCLCLIG